MSVITKNLPWFIKDLGVSIVGEKCYTSLIENLHISDVPCLKYALSKGLGVGIVLGGAVMKVPQILLILSASSARGLSLPSALLETLSYGITLSYSVRNAFPFSTYGENAFLLVQNVVITFLIILYAPSRRSRRGLSGAHGAGGRGEGREGSKGQQVLGTTVATIATAFVLQHVDMEKLALLQMATLPLSLFSKLPQIQQNYRSKSTGQLSAFAVISQILGCLARVFTTLQEVNDPLVLLSFLLALVLNVVLGSQLYVYWENTNREGRGEKEGRGEGEEGRGMGEELRELGNGSGRRGGAAVSSSVTPSVDMDGRKAPLGSFDPSSPSGVPSSTLSPSSTSYASPSATNDTPRPSEKTSGYTGEPRSPASTNASLYPEGVRSPPGRVGTPPARSGTPGGRRWSRKVD